MIIKSGWLKPEMIDKIEKDAGTRYYHIKGIGPVPSVTTITDTGMTKGYGYWKWLKENTSDDIDAIRKRALDNGTKQHETFERLSKAHFDMTVLNKDEAVDMFGVLNWKERVTPVTQKVEGCIYYADDDIQVAGRIDWAGEVYGENYVIDLKTGSGMYTSYVPQVSLYAKALGFNKAGILLLTDTRKGYRFYSVTDLDEGLKLFKSAYLQWKHRSPTSLLELIK